MIFASDLSLPEAPLLLPDGSWLVTEMGADKGSVTWLSPDGRERRIVARTGRPNGLALDGQGNVWIAESLYPSLQRLAPGGAPEVVAAECCGEPFLFPNDLAFGPDGALYMTDSGIRVQDLLIQGKIRSDFSMLPMDGRVYRIDLRTGNVLKLDEALRFANGLAFDPKGDLYVAETLTGLIHRYGRRHDGAFGPRQRFADVLLPQAAGCFAGPDGIKLAPDGTFCVAVFGQQHVAAVDGEGRIVRRLQTAGRQPTNLAFGPAGDGRVYVTEDEYGALETLQM